jgi:hypothetical protein
VPVPLKLKFLVPDPVPMTETGSGSAHLHSHVCFWNKYQCYQHIWREIDLCRTAVDNMTNRWENCFIWRRNASPQKKLPIIRRNRRKKKKIHIVLTSNTCISIQREMVRQPEMEQNNGTIWPISL